MKLTNENYFCKESSIEYMGSSQFKSFMSCEEQAMAEIKCLYQREKSTALLVGSYVDAHFSNEMSIFKAKNPEIFTRQGDLKSEYLQANYIIQRIERDPMMMTFLSGRSQVIMTGLIQGVPFKIKIDSLHPNMIVDQKIMKDFKRIWVDGVGKIPFVEAWGYDFQAAIYQEIERQNRGDFAEQLPFFIAAASKEKPEPDIAIISIPQQRIDFAMEIVKQNIERFQKIKEGLIEPKRCGKCDWCKLTKVLEEIIDYDQLGGYEIE